MIFRLLGFFCLGVILLSSLHARDVRVGVFDHPPMIALDSQKNPSGVFIDILKQVSQK